MCKKIFSLLFIALLMLGASCTAVSANIPSSKKDGISKTNKTAQADMPWTMYHNKNHNFFLRIPRYAVMISDPTKFMSESESSMPLSVFEDGDKVYITSAQVRSVPTAETGITAYEPVFSIDGKTSPLPSATSTTLPLAREAHILRIAVAKDIRSLNDLNQFIRKNFGKNCKIREKTMAEIDKNNGRFGYVPDAPRADLDKADLIKLCESAFSHTSTGFYNSVSHSAAVVSLVGGRAVTFTDFKGNVIDGEILESFKFE